MCKTPAHVTHRSSRHMCNATSVPSYHMPHRMCKPTCVTPRHMSPANVSLCVTACVSHPITCPATCLTTGMCHPQTLSLSERNAISVPSDHMPATCVNFQAYGTHRLSHHMCDAICVTPRHISPTGCPVNMCKDICIELHVPQHV